jgi:hypothetical protein
MNCQRIITKKSPRDADRLSIIRSAALSERTAIEKARGKQPQPLRTRHEQSERAAWKWHNVITQQAFCLLGRQVGDGEREGTQAVETDDPKLIVDGDENTRIAFLVLTGAKTEPIIECSHTARKSRAVMLAERFDRFDHPRSAEEMAMPFQNLDQTSGWIGFAADRREEGITIRT